MVSTLCSNAAQHAWPHSDAAACTGNEETIQGNDAVAQQITVTDTQSADVIGVNAIVLVKPAVESTMTLSGFALTSTAEDVGNFTVTLKDPYDKIAGGNTGTVRVTSSDAMAALSANYTFNLTDQGVHTFTGFVLCKKGNQKITITDTLNSSLTASVVANLR